jgi:hypothetical protein
MNIDTHDIGWSVLSVLYARHKNRFGVSNCISNVYSVHVNHDI